MKTNDISRFREMLAAEGGVGNGLVTYVRVALR